MTKRKHQVAPVEALRKLVSAGLSEKHLSTIQSPEDIGSILSRVDNIFKAPIQVNSATRV